MIKISKLKKCIVGIRHIVKILIILVVAIILILGIIKVTYKQTYSVSLNGEVIGYTQDKVALQKRINDYINSGNGENIALVSDAGTPMICDPGSYLLKELIKNKISYTALPGACAVTTFLSAIPREDEFFTFIGFMPRGANDIKEVLTDFADSNIVFYESPNRILKTLETIKDVRGNIKIALTREISKLFEESVVDTIDNVIEHYKDGIKGEIVCMIYKTENVSPDITPQIEKLKFAGYSAKDISKILSLLTDYSKNEIYKLAKWEVGFDKWLGD